MRKAGKVKGSETGRSTFIREKTLRAAEAQSRDADTRIFFSVERTRKSAGAPGGYSDQAAGRREHSSSFLTSINGLIDV